MNNAPTNYIAPITDQGDFTKMGGIYRNVRLIAVEPVHIDLMDFGSSGIYVTPKNISDSFADIDILVKLANDSSENKSITVSADILDMSGSIVASAKTDISINAKGNSETALTASAENPVLWNGRENPYLYSAEIKIMSDGRELDSFVQSFGIRTYNIDPENGFFLNGKYLDLRGTNYHQDSFENGWAMTDEQRERDFRYFGWYKDAGEPEDFGPWLDSYHGVREKRPMCISEYGGGGATSQHKDSIDWQSDIDPWGERHYENYQSELHERVWAQLSQRKYLWGKYIWCMFDFASDGREEGDTKGQNDKGLATRNRIPKDSYYFYKSVWNSEPMVHITEKRFTERPCTIPIVKAYSNAVSAELFVNGISMGTAERQNGSTVFVWENIKINCGKENIISVNAKFPDGSVIEDNAVWTGC